MYQVWVDHIAGVHLVDERRVEGLKRGVSSLGFRVSGFGFRVLDFRFRVSKSEFWVSDFGFWGWEHLEGTSARIGTRIQSSWTLVPLNSRLESDKEERTKRSGQPPHGV